MSDDTTEDTPKNTPPSQEELENINRIFKMSPEDMDDKELRIFVKLLFTTLNIQGQQFSTNDEALEERLITLEDSISGHRLRLSKEMKKLIPLSNQVNTQSDEVVALKARFNKFKKKD